MKPTRKFKLSTAIRWGGTLVSSALFIWLISRQQWGVVFKQAAGITHWVFGLALGMYIVSYGFNTLRWCILLWAQDVRFGYWRAFRITWAGNFASNFLPSTIGGDGFRMLSIYPYTHSKTLAIGSVVLDRIINMAAMACLIPVSVSMFGEKVLTSFAMALPLHPKSLVERFFPKIVSAFKTWSSHPMAFIWSFLATWPSILIPILTTYIIARQLGINVSYLQVVGIQTVTYFLSILPISVNGYGLREMAYITLYTALGASLTQASTLALVTRLLTILTTLPGGLWLTSTVTNTISPDNLSESR